MDRPGGDIASIRRVPGRFRIGSDTACGPKGQPAATLDRSAMALESRSATIFP